MLVKGPGGRTSIRMMISPFVHNPVRSRLDHVRQLIFFSDYAGAEKLLFPLIQDTKNCVDNKHSLFPEQHCIELFSLTCLTLQKLKRFTDLSDFVESFVVNEQIMERCNFFSVFYIVESFRKEPKLIELFTYETSFYKKVK